MSLVEELHDLVSMFHNNDGPGYTRMAIARLEKAITLMENENKQLNEIVKNQKADTARIDWLEQHDGDYHNIDRIVAIVGVGFNNRKSLRDAIDEHLEND